MRSVAKYLLLLVALWSLTGVAQPRIAVIIHPDSGLNDVSRKQVVDIYMGRLLSLPNNCIPLPLDQPGGSPLRERFYEALTERPLAQINAYWARLMFSGRATPPRMLPDTSSVLQAVSQNRDAIGYVEDDKLSPTVKVLFYLE
jgi:ABC-type phosphate transport system substrate-binding protein